MKNPEKMSENELRLEVIELRHRKGAMAALLKDLRDEILPNWSKREAIIAINDCLEATHD